MEISDVLRGRAVDQDEKGQFAPSSLAAEPCDADGSTTRS